MDTRNNILNSAAEAERIYYTFEEAIEEYFEDYQPHDGIRVRYKPWDFGKYPIQLFDDLFETITYEEDYDTREIDRFLSQYT